MKINNKKLLQVRRGLATTLLAFGYFTIGLAPVYASDIEVYSQSALAENTAPMVMLNLDASSSMAYCLTSNTNCTAPNRRIDALKRSMRKILYGNAAEVAADPATPIVAPAPGHLRVGMAIIQNPGNASSEGWQIKHPVRRLDDPISSGEVTVSSTISASFDDIEHNSAGGGGVTNDSELNLGSTAPAHLVGMRFQNLSVPKGATITSAYIEFTANATTTGDPLWLLSSEASDNAEDYSTKGPGHNSRTYNEVIGYNSTPSDPLETPSNIWTAEKKYQVAVTAPVQSVVSRGGWCGGNAMAFSVVTGAGNVDTRRAYSFDGSAAKAPKLVVKYTMSAAAAASTCVRQAFTQVIAVTDETNDIDWREGGTNADVDYLHSGLNAANVTGSGAAAKRLHIGLRFPGLNIARNATVSSAKLHMVESAGCGNGNCNLPNLEVAAFTPGTAGGLAPFCTTTAGVTTCTKPDETALSAAQTWVVGSFKNNLIGTTFTTNVTALVQARINDATWNYGNALGFRIRNAGTTNSSGAFYAFKSLDASKAPRLEISGIQTVTSIPASTIKTVREELMETVDSLEPKNNPPGLNTYLEAARYLLGESPSAKGEPFADPSTYVTVGAAKKFITPIVSNNQCSGNYLLYMSGGVPDSSAQSNNVAPSVVDCAAAGTPEPVQSPSQPWKCSFVTGKLLSGGSATFTRYPGATTTTSTVKTNTLILGQPAANVSQTDYNNAKADMAKLAQEGKGTPYSAASEEDLLNSLRATFAGALDEGASISAPGVAVNQLSRLNHLDELYYSVFDPDTHAFWKGNVKRYRLGLNSSDVPTVYDSQSQPAIDPDTSFFKLGAISWWTDPLDPDGRDAADGGSAEMLPAPASRRMYTYLSAYPTISSSTAAAALEPIDLSSSTFNTAAKVATGITDDTQYSNYMNWLLGYDVKNFSSTTLTNLVRKQMGGALHSRPILVNYGYTGDILTALTNSAQQDNIVYFSSMEGVLHAVDTTDGVELFSFIPKEKLATVKRLADNPVAAEPEYGMDLSWTILRDDANGDFQITTGSSGDRVWLFGGMRMGGRNYYALDLTDRNTPKVKWVVEGGSTGPYLNMGQTWSQPALGQVKINGVTKTVLFFGGGYDPDHESDSYLPSADDQGNQLYIVDADTGQLLWWASSSNAGTTVPTLTVPDLKFGVASEIKTFDYNFDGLVDTLYFGDLGGQVFRVDLNNSTTTNAGLGVRVRTLAKVGQTAVTGAPTVVDQRRFFEAPSVARFNDSTGKYVLVAMGTGYRSHPLKGRDTAETVTNDYFYVLRDNDVTRVDIATGDATSTSAGALQATLVPSDLTTVNLPSGVTQTGVSAPNGWKGDLPDYGEKVLASPIIFNGKVFFTTYVPTVVNPNPCAPIYGRTKLYEVGVTNATLTDTNNDGVVNTSDSPVTDNVVMGLGGEAQLIVLPPTILGPGGTSCGPIVLVGTKATCSGDATSGGLKRLRWYNKTKN